MVGLDPTIQQSTEWNGINLYGRVEHGHEENGQSVSTQL